MLTTPKAQQLNMLIEQTIAAVQQEKEERRIDPRTERTKKIQSDLEKITVAFCDTVKQSQLLQLLINKSAHLCTDRGPAIELWGSSVELSYLMLCLVHERSGMWTLGFYWAQLFNGNVARSLYEYELERIPRFDAELAKLMTPEGITVAIIRALYN